ncbi:MAG: hypothetical protein ABIS18_07055 [Actinomycetota bacterium]
MMDREDLIAKLEVRKPELVRTMRQFGAHEPDWQSLRKALLDGFMFMGYCDGVRMYKHALTRRYLHLDAKGNAYRWKEDHYEPIGIEEAIAHSFNGLDWGLNWLSTSGGWGSTTLMLLGRAPRFLSYPSARIEHMFDSRKDRESAHEAITQQAAHIAAATCQWLLNVAQMHKEQDWAATGARSGPHWLSWSCGIDPTSARDYLKVASCLEELPLVTETFSKGEISSSSEGHKYVRSFV